MKNYIQSLINKGEGINLDFKFAVNDSKKIARSLSAFANTEGGILLIGVKDNGVVAGVSSDEEFYMVQAAATLYTNPEVFFESKQHNVGGKTVLEIIVRKSENRPHSAPDEKGNMKAFIRLGDKNAVANSFLFKIWKSEKLKSGVKIYYSDSERFLLNYLSGNEYITLKEYKKLAKISHFKAEKILINFVRADILDMNFDKNFVKFSQRK